MIKPLIWCRTIPCPWQGPWGPIVPIDVARGKRVENPVVHLWLSFWLCLSMDPFWGRRKGSTCGTWDIPSPNVRVTSCSRSFFAICTFAHCGESLHAQYGRNVGAWIFVSTSCKQRNARTSLPTDSLCVLHQRHPFRYVERDGLLHDQVSASKTRRRMP